MYDQMMQVSRGYKLIFIGIGLVVAGYVALILVALLLSLLAAGGAAGPALRLAAIAPLISVVLIVVGAIISVVGQFFCLAVPNRAGSSKGKIITAVVFLLLSLAGSIIGAVNLLAGHPLSLTQGQILQFASGLFSLLSVVFFLLFTRSLAQFIREHDLAETASAVLKLWGATIGFYLVGVVVIVVGILIGGGVARAGDRNAGGNVAGVGACLGVIVMLIAVVLGLVAFVRYVGLLRSMSDATARYARRKKPKTRYEDDDADEGDEEEDRPRQQPRQAYQGFEVVEDEDDEDDRPRQRRR